MGSVRRGFAITTVERQLSFLIQMAVTIVVSRLLTPAEIGVWGVAMAATGLLLGLREFATETFLIQRPKLSREEVQAAFTLMLIVSFLIFSVLMLLAPWLANFYRDQGVVPVIRVAALAVLLEVITTPLVALMRRHMAFGDVAVVNLTRGVTIAAVTVGLAWLGFSYMSFAWGWLAGAFLTGVVSICLRPDTWVYRPHFRGWKEMLAFGGYSGVNVILYKIYETLPALLLGRTLSLDAVGNYNRAALVSQLPNNILLSGIGTVLLPALSADVRAGQDVKDTFFRAVSIFTAFQWPGLIMLAIFAHSLVSLLLGAQWLQTVPLIQIMALAALPSFATELAFPVLVAVGAMRDVLWRALLSWPTSAVIIGIAAQFGLMAVVLSLFVTFPLQAVISLCLVRRHLAFEWRDLGKACWKSAVIAAASAAGPLAISAWWGFGAAPSIIVPLLAAGAAAAGWIVAVRYTQHELLDEIRRAANFVMRLWMEWSPRRR